MKKIIVCLIILLALCFVFVPCCSAQTADLSEEALSGLNAAVSDEVREKMEKLGYDGDLTGGGSVGFRDFASLLLSEFASSLSGPLAGCALIIGVLILSSFLEGYTHSLRYTEMREVMTAVSSLLLSAVLVAPLTGLIRRSAAVITDTASLMLVYVPVIVGILCFGGHAVQAGGYCATVMTGSQAVAQLSARFVPRLLCAYLALCIACGVSGGVKLSGFCELLGRFIKWFLGIMMALFSMVLSLQSVIARAGDTVASRAARMTLSSLVPLIGSALSEAYKTVQGSVDLLRSGSGVFVILVLLVTYLPVLVQCVLWLVTVRLCGCAAEALGTAAPVRLLGTVASVLNVLIALVLSVMTAFIIATAVLIHAGGAS